MGGIGEARGVLEVEAGGEAFRVGIRSGDRLLSVNGAAPRDAIDFQCLAAQEDSTVVVEREGRKRRFRIHREYGRPLGLSFRDPLFDGFRRCENRCPFCFVNQLPEGLRRTLYVKDDDYRLSFLNGSYVTLTNLEERDWDRIGEQSLSPLYVSVHATDPQIRARLLGIGRSPEILGQLERLGELNVEVHAQIVMVPGINDGRVLADTVRDLAGLYPTVRSTAIVPWGRTRYNRVRLRPVSVGLAKRTVARAAAWQQAYRARLGAGFVYPSDELYLMADAPVPDADAYDGFPQLENGVGMTRQLLDLWGRVRQRAQGVRQPHSRISIVCGTLIGPTLKRIGEELGELERVDVDVIPVVNRFFGPSVTVSGLPLGRDVIEAVEARKAGDVVILPRDMFDAEGGMTLDDLTRDQIEDRLGAPVRVAATIDEIIYLGGLSVA